MGGAWPITSITAALQGIGTATYDAEKSECHLHDAQCPTMKPSMEHE